MTYEELGIDPTRLKRDYIKNPLKRREFANKDDLYYLAIELLLLPENFIALFNWNVNKVNYMLKKLNICRTGNVLVNYRKKCFKQKYGVENPQQIKRIRQKTAETNIKRYGGVAPMCSAKIKDEALTTFFSNRNELDIETAKNRRKIKNQKHEEYRKTHPKILPLTYEEFKITANKIHNNKYAYPDQEFKNLYTKIKIICPIHGEFKQYPNYHLKGGGCRFCAIENDIKRKYMSQEQFIAKCKKIFPDYDYSQVIYTGTHHSVDVVCPKHGKFTILASNILANHGCPRCKQRTPTKESFVEAANIKHFNEYDYSKAIYINNNIKLEIICPKHGSFWSTPGNHLAGKGCPKCKTSKGENKIRDILNSLNIVFVEQKRFKDCKDKKPLPFDFYLEDYNTCIEYQGEQHYMPVKRGNQTLEQLNEALKQVQFHDSIKRNYCKEKGIELLEIHYNEDIEVKLKEFIEKK